MSDDQLIFKCIVVGDSGTGKTCLLSRFINDQFRLSHNTTIGVEFCTHVHTIDNQTIKLQIWDTAGQEKFNSITRLYYRGSVCVFVVFDITNRESFIHIQSWIKDIKECNTTPHKLILIGNKIDKIDKIDKINAINKINIINTIDSRQVTTQEAITFAEKHNMKYFETSAKTGDNVTNMFDNSIKMVYDAVKDGSIHVLTHKKMKKMNGQNYGSYCGSYCGC